MQGRSRPIPPPFDRGARREPFSSPPPGRPIRGRASTRGTSGHRSLRHLDDAVSAHGLSLIRQRIPLDQGQRVSVRLDRSGTAGYRHGHVRQRRIASEKRDRYNRDRFAETRQRGLPAQLSG